jgi:hypothetical protein
VKAEHTSPPEVAIVVMKNRGRQDKMAHIEQRKRYGKITYRARYSDPDGRERSRVFVRKGDAEKYLSTIEVSKLRGEWIDPTLGKTTFGDYADSWLTTKHVAASTMANVRGRLDKWARPFFGEMPLARVQPTHARIQSGSARARACALDGKGDSAHDRPDIRPGRR